MKETPIISIMIPIYNTGQYLERCIDSVINQTIKDIEIILVDDGSTDGSAEVCDRYVQIDSRVKVIHKHNGGLASARIAGIENACGEWLGFVDSDDWIDSDMYQELYESVRGQEDIDIAIGGYVEEKNEGTVHIFSSGKTRVMEPRKALIDMFECRDYNWSLCDKLYRHTLFDKNLVYDWPKSYGEDTYINWHVFNKCRKISYAPVMGYHYFMNSESMMHKRVSKGKFDYCRIYNHILNDLDIDKTQNRELAKKIMDIALDTCMPIIHYAQEEYDQYKKDIENALEQMRFYLSYIDKYDESEKTGKDNAMFEHIDMDRETALRVRNQRDEELLRFANGKPVFLYGAGKIAEDVMYLLDKLNISVCNVVVSEIKGNKTFFCGKEIIGVKQLIANNMDVIVVLAMNKKNTDDVLEIVGTNSFIKTINAGIYSIYY